MGHPARRRRERPPPSPRSLDGWEPRAEGWWGQFERFGDWLDGTAPDLPVTLADARASIELITAMYDSGRRGVDVALPLSPDHPLYDGWLPT